MQSEHEDGDGHDETFDEVVKTRKWLRREVSKYPTVIGGMLADIELMAKPFFLGLDYDDNRDDVDDVGPF